MKYIKIEPPENIKLAFDLYTKEISKFRELLLEARRVFEIATNSSKDNLYIYFPIISVL